MGESRANHAGQTCVAAPPSIIMSALASSRPVGLTEVLMPLVLLTSCWHKMYCWRLLFLRCCGWWCCQRRLWCLLGLLALLPIVLVIACLVTAIPAGIVASVWVIPVCRAVVLLLICCVRQVVDCSFAAFGQVTWLATCVAYCHWVISFPLVVGSFVLSLSFVCSFHWLPRLFSVCFPFSCIQV